MKPVLTTETSAVVLFQFHCALLHIVPALALPSRENRVSGHVEYNWGGDCALARHAQVGKPAWSHSPFRVMGSFPESYRNPDQHSRKLVCGCDARYWKAIGKTCRHGLPHVEGRLSVRMFNLGTYSSDVSEI
jgi:hypothetical protein